MFGKTFKFVSTVIFLVGISSNLLLHAQIASSTRDGVYTADQAIQGKAVYSKQCAMCHGVALEGTGQNAPLAGDDFLNNWDGQSVADLFAKIHTTMPATNPGSLTPTETAQTLAFILSVNQFPAGKTELPDDPDKLTAIRIDKPQAKP